MSVEDYIKSNTFGRPNCLDKGSVDHFDCFNDAAEDIGVKVLLKKKNRRIFDYNGIKIGSSADMITSFTTAEAKKICKDKQKTLLKLKEVGINVPFFKAFNPDNDYELAYDWFSKNKDEEKGFVLKPSNGRAGRGVSVGIKTLEDFKRAWQKAYDNLTAKDGTILIEERLIGIDLRVIVVDGRFVCAATRLPAHIVGNGKSNILELVNEKNSLRTKHAYYRLYPLIIPSDEDLDYVPACGEVFLISRTSNIHQGGEAVDLTEFVSEDIKKIAERAASAIPGLGVSGIDFILDKTLSYGKIIEINTACNFMVHFYPYYGKSRNPAYYIIKSMIDSPHSRRMIFENISGGGTYLKRLLRYIFILKN